MNNTKTLQAVVGSFVILGILSLVFLAYKVSSVNSIGKDGTYALQADFVSVSGLKSGAAVTVAGVKIGQVQSIVIDMKTYKARVMLAIDNKYQTIPYDSSASVLTQGLLGEKYIGIDIGGEEEYMQAGDSFIYTKSSVVLEKLIDKFFYNSSKK